MVINCIFQFSFFKYTQVSLKRHKTSLKRKRQHEAIYLDLHCYPYGENLIAPCSQVHDNFIIGVNRKFVINLMYLFIPETSNLCKRALIIYYLPIIDMYFLYLFFRRKMVCF